MNAASSEISSADSEAEYPGIPLRPLAIAASISVSGIVLVCSEGPAPPSPPAPWHPAQLLAYSAAPPDGGVVVASESCRPLT